MSANTSIEWTNRTWNPVRGCTRVSEGCRRCYAEKVAHRFSGPGMPYEGLTRITNGRPQWTGKIALVESALGEPLKWRKPSRVFVNSMSDLFHEGVPDEFIARVFATMDATPWHTYQVLTKRPERMREWVNRGVDNPPPLLLPHQYLAGAQPWPLPNVWLGVSVEDQPTADARIPHLLETPGAVRFVSYEPALGPVNFWRYTSLLSSACPDVLDWVIVGGESGPHARPFDVQWARDTRDACRAAGVAFFMKQLGALPYCWADPDPDGSCAEQKRDLGLRLKDPKGGDMSEWPEDLRIRMFPGEEWKS